MGNLFSADNSVALLLPQALESGGDAVAYPWLAPLPDALGEVEGYAKTSDAHQAAMRASMQAPGDGALLGAALEALAPGVRAVVRWGDLADGVAAKLPPLVGAFAAEAKALVAKKALVEGGAPPAATAALLELLEFLLAFDGAKLVTPCIQNEFAFIKRAAQKDPGATSVILDSNRAPAVSMFIAQASPMLAAAAGAVDAPGAKALGALAAGCAQALQGKKLGDGAASKCCRAMVAALVLVDLANKTPGGAFGGAGGCQVAKCVAAIKKRAAPGDAPKLLSAVQYTTRNYGQHASAAVRTAVEG